MIPVEFTSSESLVRGHIFPSASDAVLATVIFLQGFPGVDGDELICARLAQESVNVLTFTYRGTLRSEGYFSFSNAVSDIGAALRFVKEPRSLKDYRVDPEKIVLGGWSFGSGLVPAGAAQHPEFARIFAISGRNFGDEAHRLARDPEYAEQVARNLEAIRAPNGPVAYRDDLITDLIEHQDSFEAAKLAPLLKDRDILLIGAWDDDIVAIEEHIIPFYRTLVENGADKVRIEALQDDHEFSGSRDRLVRIIVDWLREE